MARLFVGLDLSTTGLKIAVLEEDGARGGVLRERELPAALASVVFDSAFPEFGTRGGVLRAADGSGDAGAVHSPVALWLRALERLFAQLCAAGALPRGSVRAISGSAQQHGSVYWAHGAGAALAALPAATPLADALAPLLARPLAPVWMDSSTRAECAELEALVGGAAALAAATGSVAHERFTAAQMRKVRTRAGGLDSVERISLVSSFGASLFAGAFAPIDWADASGMNLLELRSKSWLPRVLAWAVGERGAAKLGAAPCPSWRVLGRVAPHVAARWPCFAPDCAAVAWSGDNPCSLAGLRLRCGDVAVSLGTSDTVFGPLRGALPQLEGHVFLDPVHADAEMALLCFKNGARVRERVRDAHAGGSWATFSALLAATSPGNEGRLGVFYDDPEITPRAPAGQHLVDAHDAPCDGADWPAGAHVRAVLEAQSLAMRHHAQRIGVRVTSSILVTGGASTNVAIAQVVADTFGVPVFALNQPNSAALGAAYRAYHAVRCAEAPGGHVPFDELFPAGREEAALIAEPRADAHAVYDAALLRYAALEARVVAGVARAGFGS